MVYAKRKNQPLQKAKFAVKFSSSASEVEVWG